jgi:hypothetical protein
MQNIRGSDLPGVVPNIKQPIMWSYEVWSEFLLQLNFQFVPKKKKKRRSME